MLSFYFSLSLLKIFFLYAHRSQLPKSRTAFGGLIVIEEKEEETEKELSFTEGLLCASILP